GSRRRRRGLRGMALTLTHARACVERGITKAHALGFDVAIAVVDESGHLVICERMDGALWVTPEIARAKANAAAGFRATTLEVEVSQNDVGEWVATAIEYQVSATGRTEKEALARIMEALAAHIKKAAQ